MKPLAVRWCRKKMALADTINRVVSFITFDERKTSLWTNIYNLNWITKFTQSIIHWMINILQISKGKIIFIFIRLTRHEPRMPNRQENHPPLLWAPPPPVHALTLHSANVGTRGTRHTQDPILQGGESFILGRTFKVCMRRILCYSVLYCWIFVACISVDINVKGWSWTFSVFWFVFPFLAKLDSSDLCSKCTTFSGECCPCSLPVQGLFQLILLPVHSLLHSKKVSGYLGVQLCSLVMTHYHPVVEVDQSSTSVCFTHS